VRVLKVADGYWVFVWIAGVDSEDVVALADCHGTVTADTVAVVTRLGANVNLSFIIHGKRVVTRVNHWTQVIQEYFY